MELKPGYKQTEAGVIPEDWDAKDLGSILNQGRIGGNYPNQDRETNYPLMKMGNIGRGSIDVGKIEYVSSGNIPDEKDRLQFADLLFNTRNTLDLVGKVAIWRNELPVAYYNSNLMRLEFKPEEISSNFFANYVFNSNDCLSRLRAIATGTTSVAAIYTRDLLQISFLVPPKSEQEAIAAALSDVDTLIRWLDQLIAKKRDLKQAAMQQLLTGKQRLPGFRGEWEVKRLGDVATIATGNTPPTRDVANYGDEFLFVSPGDLGEEKFVFDTEKKLSKAGFAISRQFPKGSILFTCIGSTIGKSGIAPVELTSNQQINAILPSSSFSNEYLYYSLCMLAPKVRALAGEQAVPIVNKAQFSDTAVSLPPLSEQTAIATVLSDMDAELAALEQRRDKTRDLKQGMMQELLTGRIRLV